MDKVALAGTIAIIGAVLTVMFAVIGTITTETKIIQTPILDSKTGKYYQGYKEIEEYPHPQIIEAGVTISFIIIIIFVGLMLWWGR